jgi:hypothetical protein
MYHTVRFTINGLVNTNHYLHIAASHLGDGGHKLASVADLTQAPVKQCDVVTRLQTQNLHMPSDVGGQV